MKKIIFDLKSKVERRAFLIGEKNKIEKWYFDNLLDENIQGNIYIAKIVYVDYNLKLAFIDYGGKQNGFLSFEDLPEIYGESNAFHKIAKIDLNKIYRSNKLLDQENFEYEEGQNTFKEIKFEVGRYLIVQAIKNATHNKGASFSTKIIFNSQYFIFMPLDIGVVGVSKNILHVRNQVRKNLSYIFKDGFVKGQTSIILRSSGVKKTVNDLVNDLEQSIIIWNNIVSQLNYNVKLVYKNDNFCKEVIYEFNSEKIGSIIVNNETYLNDIRKINTDIKVYYSDIDLHEYDKQVLELYNSYVYLSCGGFLIIQKTEALYSIDVNSGNTDVKVGELNLEAAIEAARQIKLRNLSGMIVIDFIDDKENSTGENLKEILEKNLSDDKVRVNVLDMNSLGLICISRQRKTIPFIDLNNTSCDLCLGKGFLRGNQVVYMFKIIEKNLMEKCKPFDVVNVRVNYYFAENILNLMKMKISELERVLNIQINFVIDYAIPYERFILETNGKEIVRYEEVFYKKPNIWTRFKRFFHKIFR